MSRGCLSIADLLGRAIWAVIPKAYFICIFSLEGGTRPFMRRYTTTFP
jgi:hypothetical protein